MARRGECVAGMEGVQCVAGRDQCVARRGHCVAGLEGFSVWLGGVSL